MSTYFVAEKIAINVNVDISCLMHHLVNCLLGDRFQYNGKLASRPSLYDMLQNTA